MKGRQIDYPILITVFLLTVFGLMMLASASSDLGKTKFDNSYYYLQHQIYYGLSLGLAGFFTGLYLPARWYKKFSTFALLLSVLSLIIVFTPLGSSAGTAAERWISIGPITFQPSEILKLTFVFYLAAWLSGAKSRRADNLTQGYLPFLVMCGIIALLLVLEKSTSSVLIIMSGALAIYFASGAKWRYILTTILLGIAALALLVAVTGYRSDRIKTFFTGASDSSGAGYQLNISQTTIGAGGIWGVGYGKSIAKRYLPERIGDSIFPIIAEEFGFVGSLSIVGMFFFLIFRSYQLSRRVGDRFGRLVLIGFGTIIGAQVFLHIGSNVGLIPITGVPLPFISYGGTALAVFLTMSGVMLNISKDA